MTAQRDCDVLVVGSGAGGLAAADAGLRGIMAEKAGAIGGATAWSGGWMWVPHNHLAEAAGIVEHREAPKRSLRGALGNPYRADLIDRYLDIALRMLRFFEARTALEFMDGNAISDFHTIDGAAMGGRSVCAAPYDGRHLGDPLAETTIAGMAAAAGVDMAHVFNATRSATSALHVARRVGRHGWDLLRHRRGPQRVNGNALAARLLRSALDRGVEIWADAPVHAPTTRDAQVTGARVRHGDEPVPVAADTGVVLACGGFPHDTDRRAATFPHTQDGTAHWAAAPRENTGDGLRLGEGAGGTVATDLATPGAWAPGSLVPRRDGGFTHFPNLIDRAKPGVIALRHDGHRFVNEADSDHAFMSALFAATPEGDPVIAWLICDHRFKRRYGLGWSRPLPYPLKPCLACGYLHRGDSPSALAQACGGIDADALSATLENVNVAARNGEDPAFGRGQSPYNRVQGETTQTPNPCVAQIKTPPFYAVQVLPGSLGTFAGQRTDTAARALDADGDGAPVPGLHTVGNHMASIMSGRNPSGGITLGQAMTFGDIAGRTLAGIDPAT